MEPDYQSKPGLKNIDSSSSSSVVGSITDFEKDPVSSFQSLNLSENQQDHNYVKKDESFDNEEPHHPYPLKHGIENCQYYMRTGTCSFGMNCRFNHPIWKVRGSKQEKEGCLDRTKHMDCEFNLAPGECKDGATCNSRHSKEKIEIESVELNFLGLPIRLGERDCAFYMQNAACADGTDCRFNHPEPTYYAGSIPLNRTAADISMDGRLENEKEILKEDSNILQHMGSSFQYPASQSFDVMLGKNFSNQRSSSSCVSQQSSKPMFLEEYPERPGQPLCDYFMKTGFCKYKSSCRYHHPKKQDSTMSSHVSTKMTSPLRLANAEERGICKFYGNFGTCKYGSACMFNHPNPLQ